MRISCCYVTIICVVNEIFSIHIAAVKIFTIKVFVNVEVIPIQVLAVKILAVTRTSGDASTRRKFVGETGELIESDGSDRPYKVKCSNGSTYWFYPEEIEAASGGAAGSAR